MTGSLFAGSAVVHGSNRALSYFITHHLIAGASAFLFAILIVARSRGGRFGALVWCAGWVSAAGFYEYEFARAQTYVKAPHVYFIGGILIGIVVAACLLMPSSRRWIEE